MTQTQSTDFEELTAPYRAELLAHCYRMLGSSQDAEDALQETLLRAWKGLPRFEGRSSLRSWLYRIATNSSLKLIERRPKRVVPVDFGPPGDPHDDIAPAIENVWVEPFQDESVPAGFASPEARYEQRESVELAFIAAVQHLPPRQRAVLLLRDVLGFKPAEIADAIEATPAAVSSALQRAHAAIDERLPDQSQQAIMKNLGDARVKEIVERYVDAWDSGSIDKLMTLLAEDAIVAMPPRPTWFRGREACRQFMATRPFFGDVEWRSEPVFANGQLAFSAALRRRDGSGGPGREVGDGFVHHGVHVLTLTPGGQIAEYVAFIDQAMD